MRSLLFVVLGASALVLGLTKQQAARDWWALHDYTPPAAVAALSSDTAMTPTAQKLFYVNHPAIDDRKSFNTACSSTAEHTIVLGCYHGVDRGIYVFDVTDARLNGVKQVTAAHEMLHAAYDRLSASDKKHVDAMLTDYYQHDLHDARIQQTIDAYKKSEPNDLVNEMHSIFGTEVASLPAPLEAYYTRYFSDRQKVVNYANAYQAEFSGRDARVKAYDAQLSDLKSQIDSNTALLKSREGDIMSQRNQLEAYRNAGATAAYNSGVDSYNAKVDAYNNLIEATRGEIASYNQIVNERNALVVEVRSLAQSIDSHLTTIN